MANQLPPPPIGVDANSFEYQDWLNQLRNLTNTNTFNWSSIDFTGSNLTDITTRNHNDLQSKQGGATSEYYHLSAAEHAALTGSLTGSGTPTFTGLTVVLGGGSVAYAGRFQKHGNVVKFTITITPSGGATTASTAGTTYCDAPTSVGYSDTCAAGNDTTKVAVGNGVVDSTNDRVYSPSWTATSDVIVLSGSYEV